MTETPRGPRRPRPASPAAASSAAPWAGAATGAFLSAGALAPTVSTFASVPVRVQRFPLAIGVVAVRDLRAAGGSGRTWARRSRCSGSRAKGSTPAGPALRFDAGARVGVSVRLPAAWRGWAPAMTLHGEYFPRAYQIDVDPLGTIGSLGRYSVGVAAGVSYRGVSANSCQ